MPFYFREFMFVNYFGDDDCLQSLRLFKRYTYCIYIAAIFSCSRPSSHLNSPLQLTTFYCYMSQTLNFKRSWRKTIKTQYRYIRISTWSEKQMRTYSTLSAQRVPCMTAYVAASESLNTKTADAFRWPLGPTNVCMMQQVTMNNHI